VATNIIMPALGIAQDTGKLLQWLKEEGQAVSQGEVLMVVETDKATVEIEAPASGVLSQVTAKVGDDVPVGQTIAFILAPGETPVAAQPATQSTVPASAPSDDKVPSTPVAASPLARRIAEENGVDLSQVKPSGERIEKADVLAYLEARQPRRSDLASPKARGAAAQAGLDLSTITGSGPDGAVLYADVLAAQAAATMQPAPAPVQASANAPTPITVTPEVIKPSTVWRIMAERTTQSWTNVPHFYLSREVNASRLITWRERAQKRAQQRSSEKITYTDLLVRLVAAALSEHPRVNVTWQDGAIHLLSEVSIGLAVAVEEGLTVPVIHRADTLTIVQIAQQRAALVARAQAGKLRPEDISGGTFTISNLGMYGVDTFNAIVNPPQAAILAVGRIVQRVTPVEDRPAVQPMMTLTLSCDHRAIDGARGAQFLQTLADMIEEPLGLLD
jgi:pyruvate dehydrogenase E2 component (dihydrolipoamide acetyltransferase)